MRGKIRTVATLLHGASHGGITPRISRGALAAPSAGCACSAVVGAHRSSGGRPVCFAVRASIRGPISASSWKANTNRPILSVMAFDETRTGG
jgi:hypothetical protein